MTSSYETIGRPVGRAEGPAKVTGKAIFPADVNLPGILVGKCLRSPFPYAKIVSIDADSVANARRVPGGPAVLTSDDIPSHLVGRMLRDMPILARDVVRFAGQKVVAVAAEDDDIAEVALNLIQIEYDELEPILDPNDSLNLTPRFYILILWITSGFQMATKSIPTPLVMPVGATVTLSKVLPKQIWFLNILLRRTTSTRPI